MNKKIEDEIKQFHDELLKRSATYMFEEFMKRIRIKQYIREQEKKGATFIYKTGKDGQYWIEEKRRSK